GNVVALAQVRVVDRWRVVVEYRRVEHAVVAGFAAQQCRHGLANPDVARAVEDFPRAVYLRFQPPVVSIYKLVTAHRQAERLTDFALDERIDPTVRAVSADVFRQRVRRRRGLAIRHSD